MYTLLLMALVSVVAADVSHLGYQYQVPHTSYGVPAYNYNTGSSSGSSYKEQTTSHGHGGFAQQNAGGQGGYNAGFGQEHLTNGGYKFSGNVGSTSGYQSFGSSSGFTSGYQPSGHRSSGVTVHQAPAQVFKHVYVHEAPEEPEPVKPRQQLVLPPPQKHYKIIFIKAPSSVVYTPKYIPVPQQNEEKTIVYLLSKKTEELHDEVVPQFEAKPPAKPEVFFVKYQNKEDSQAVINNIVQEHNKDGSALISNTFGSDGASGGYYTQNSGSGEYSQQDNSGLVSGTSSYVLQKHAPSTVYGQSQYSSGQHSHSSGVPGVADHSVSSHFDGTVDTISTSQRVPHSTYSKFRD